jgi:CubicO group peptidase (beta-lactamase class C family)
MNIGKKVQLDRLIGNQYSNIAGIVVVKNDVICYEKYGNGYTADDTIHIASVTKSIVSALIGMAIHKGYIRDLHQRVLDFFPDYIPKRGEKTIQLMTIHHLLTMTAPYKFSSEPYTKVYSSGDWTKAALDLLGGKRGPGEFQYTTVGCQILTGILANATGQSVLDFASEHLFAPLEIKAPRSAEIKSKEDYLAFLKGRHASGCWVVDPGGIHTGGWGLALTTRDLLKIGQLYGNGGLWNGKAILPAQWIKDSTRESSRWGDKPYGYLWWVVNDGDQTCYAAIGDGGNVIYVNPEQNTIVAIASIFMPRARDRMELIRGHIEPLLEEGGGGGGAG